MNPTDSFIPDDTVNSVEGTFRLGVDGAIDDQSTDALIDAALLQIVGAKDGFTSRYDRALRIFQLASSQEDMANPVALTIRDAIRFMVDRVSSLVVAVDGAPPDELPEGHLANSLSFTESELLFVSVKAYPYICHFSINLGEMEGTYIGALTRDALIVGVLSWLVEKRSDVAKRSFPVGSLMCRYSSSASRSHRGEPAIWPFDLEPNQVTQFPPSKREYLRGCRWPHQQLRTTGLFNLHQGGLFHKLFEIETW